MHKACMRCQGTSLRERLEWLCVCMCMYSLSLHYFFGGALLCQEHLSPGPMICPHCVSMLTASVAQTCPAACYKRCPAALPPDALLLHSRHTVMLLAVIL